VAVGDASIIDPDDVHRIEDRSALECRTARHHQEPAFVLAESSRTLIDRISACGTAGCPEFADAYADADADAYGVNTSDPWG